jgi:hypothetical protein
MREYQVRICERLGVKFPGPTRQSRRFGCEPRRNTMRRLMRAAATAELPINSVARHRRGGCCRTSFLAAKHVPDLHLARAFDLNHTHRLAVERILD